MGNHMKAMVELILIFLYAFRTVSGNELRNYIAIIVTNEIEQFPGNAVKEYIENCIICRHTRCNRLRIVAHAFKGISSIATESRNYQRFRFFSLFIIENIIRNYTIRKTVSNTVFGAASLMSFRNRTGSIELTMHFFNVSAASTNCEHPASPFASSTSFLVISLAELKVSRWASTFFGAPKNETYSLGFYW